MLFVVLLVLFATSVVTPAKLKVPEDFLYTMIWPSVDVELAVGQSLNLTCECTSQTANLTMVRVEHKEKYRPIHDNLTETVNSTRHFWSRKTLVYTITDAKLSDAGEYTCIARNKRETMVYQPGIEVMVFENAAPIIRFFSGKNGLMAVHYKSRVNLECDVRGYPRPSVKWFKDGKHVTSNVKVTSFKDASYVSLIMQDFSQGDAGKYTCKASNVYGHANADVTVTLKEYSPKVHSTKISSSSRNGMLPTLECTLTGYPVPRVTWYKGNDVMSCSDNYKNSHTHQPCSLIQGITSVLVRGKPKIFEDTTLFSKNLFKVAVPTFEKVVAVKSKLQIHGHQIDSLDSYSCEARNQLGTSSHTFTAHDVIKKLKKV